MADDGNTLVTQGTSHVQGHSKPHFSCAILVLWGCFINSMILQVFSNQNYSLVLFGKEQWEAGRVPCQPAGGFALCWIKPDLLILSWLHIIFARGKIFRKQFSPTSISKPTTLLCWGRCKFAFQVWKGWEGRSRSVSTDGVGDTDTAWHST